MSLDKKQIALSVGGILAGLSLTYILWKRSQDAAAATASANATAAAQEQQSQEIDYSSAASGLSSAGGGGSSVTNNYSDTPATQTGTASGDDDASDISSIVNQILGAANASLPTIPGNALIPEVDINDASTALTGIDTSAAEILGYAPAGTVSTTTSTGQGYGATTSPVAGGDSNTVAPVNTPAPVNATPIFSSGGGNPRLANLPTSSSLVN